MTIIADMPTGLTPDEQQQWAEANLTLKQRADWYIIERQRAQIRAGCKITRTIRKQLLLSQQGQCALCQENIPHGSTYYLIKEQAVIVCPGCHQYLVARRSARAKGVTEELTLQFEQSA